MTTVGSRTTGPESARGRLAAEQQYFVRFDGEDKDRMMFESQLEAIRRSDAYRVRTAHRLRAVMPKARTISISKSDSSNVRREKRSRLSVFLSGAVWTTI